MMGVSLVLSPRSAATLFRGYEAFHRYFAGLVQVSPRARPTQAETTEDRQFYCLSQ
jgi:hypothetical protein